MKKIFLSLNIISVIFGHFAMFFIWRYFLDINGLFGQAIIAGVLLVAIFLTVLSPLLIHFKDHYFNRGLYLVMSLWIGFVINTAIIAGLALLTEGIITAFAFDQDLSFFIHGLYIIFLPLLMIPFEAMSAVKHRIKKVEIEIRDLPEAWEGKEVVHLSDIHLGPIYREKSFTRIIRKVNALNPEAIFITGDLFDGMEADFSWFEDPYRHVHAPKGVYYVYGNHDLLMGKEKVRELLGHSAIQVLDNETKMVDGLQIVGVTCLFDRKMDFEKTIIEQAGYDKKKPSILLFHEPRYIKEAREVSIELQLSGHTHNGQMFPGNILSQILYKGHAYGVHQKKDGYNLIVSAGTGTWGPPLRIGHRSEIILIKLKKK